MGKTDARCVVIFLMLPNDEYPKIETHMSDSNVKGRHVKGIKDHLFIFNGFIQKHNITNESL